MEIGDYVNQKMGNRFLQFFLVFHMNYTGEEGQFGGGIASGVGATNFQEMVLAVSSLGWDWSLGIQRLRGVIKRGKLAEGTGLKSFRKMCIELTQSISSSAAKNHTKKDWNRRMPVLPSSYLHFQGKVSAIVCRGLFGSKREGLVL